MKKMLIVSIAMMFLVACATTEKTPLEPTNTPIPPTPTDTPTPTPIPPTPTPTLIPIEDLIEQLDPELIGQLMGEERNQYSMGYYRIAIGIATELIDTWLGDYPMFYELRAESYSRLGDFENAIKDAEEAVKRIPPDDDPIWASTYNDLCWYLAIAGEPDEALPHCEEAVRLDSQGMYLDSRGLAYALLGRNADAVADFEEVIEELEGVSDQSLVEIRESREQWVADLGAGKDLNTPEFLEELQAEEIDQNAFPEPEVLQAKDYTRTHFSKSLKNDGFRSSGVFTTDSGVEYEHQYLAFNGCGVSIFIIGPETETWGIDLILWECTKDQVIGETLWFLQFVLYQDPQAKTDGIEVGQGYAWIMKDVMDVYAGEIDETDEEGISGIDFTAAAMEDADLGSGINISAFFP
jgi:hypothetical protein